MTIDHSKLVHYASNLAVLFPVLFIYLITVEKVTPINGALFMLASNASLFVMVYYTVKDEMKGKA